ncbi:hypothetical protein DRQ25_10825 [Candidatus Fermentibacteria bacterium]|nr:MAG: hypothetical protein DRQ25_10825 [Candidatus Fermentibacteria bacterium]
MVYAILLIFFGMFEAEQAVIIQAACDVPPPQPVSLSFDHRDGVIKTFGDGSTLTVTNYSTLARNPDGVEVYFTGD